MDFPTHTNPRYKLLLINIDDPVLETYFVMLRDDGYRIEWAPLSDELAGHHLAGTAFDRTGLRWQLWAEYKFCDDVHIGACIAENFMLP